MDHVPRINCICPAGTKTGITANFSVPEAVDGALMARYSGFRGLAEAEDIANTIAFIASEDARHVHGAIFSVDNGVTAG